MLQLSITLWALQVFFSPLWSLTLHPIHSSSLLPRSASRSLLEWSSLRNTIPPNPTRSYHHFTLETCKSLLHQKLKLKVAIVLKIAELSHTSWLNFLSQVIWRLVFYHWRKYFLNFWKFNSFLSSIQFSSIWCYYLHITYSESKVRVFNYLICFDVIIFL